LKPASHIKDSINLKRKLTDTYVPYGYTIISLDVVSLFTSVPFDLILQAIENRACYIHTKSSIPYDSIIEALKFIYNNTYFMFNGIYYLQKHGTPMGLSISSLLADIVLEDLEKHCIKNLAFDIIFYYRYVDDIILCLPDENTIDILNSFNNYHHKLKFTIEKEIDNQISFLDLKLIKINNSIIIDWYHKETFSGRYVNFYSQQPLIKRQVLFTI